MTTIQDRLLDELMSARARAVTGCGKSCVCGGDKEAPCFLCRWGEVITEAEKIKRAGWKAHVEVRSNELLGDAFAGAPTREEKHERDGTEDF